MPQLQAIAKFWNFWLTHKSMELFPQSTGGQKKETMTHLAIVLG